METLEVFYDAPEVPPPDPSEMPSDIAGLAFPGCTARRITRDEIGCYEGRLEFWDGQIATAWVAQPSPAHEVRSAGLVDLVGRIAIVRGAPIKCYGHMDLMVRDGDGAPRRIVQADQSLYLDAAPAIVLDQAPAMVVGEHPLPDVVLEVDHTTDARRGKLSLYESWGFPEVWVEVPDRRSRRRPASRPPGLTIHVLRDGRFRESPESQAFPGWTAEEIHAALNEHTPSARTHGVLARVGSVLGIRGGTGPDDDPLLASQRLAARNEARSEARSETVAEMARAFLRQRGIAVSPALAGDPALFADCSEETVAAAALACTSERDFIERLNSPDAAKE